MSPLSFHPKVITPLDTGFLPSVLWNRAFENRVQKDPKARPIIIGVGTSSSIKARIVTSIHNEESPFAADAFRYVERWMKGLLWTYGGSRVILGGAKWMARELSRQYSPQGKRAFDAEILGDRIYREKFQIESCLPEAVPEVKTAFEERLGGHLEGCRIGFDLGGSDRKAAAMIDGKRIFSEEIPWDPYFQKDPQYHFDGILDSLQRAAKHLPQIDAIGGSAAGVYVENEVRAASLFRGVSQRDFQNRVRRIFFEVMSKMGWQDIPWRVTNDGEVTALAGSMAIQENRLLGLSLGTSLAAGYVASSGNLSGGLNELAFVPIDYRNDAPIDEWSGDRGCAVQYLSQQALGRLAKPIFHFESGISLPEQLAIIQEKMTKGDPLAMQIYRSLGIYLGYAIAQFARFYELQHLLLLGRVSTGIGGEVLLSSAREVLEKEFPELSQSLRFHIPDEKQKRHGQAIAAASLASLKKI